MPFDFRLKIPSYSLIVAHMRIAIVRRHCSLKKAGAERYCVNLFRGLQKLGHQVTVVGEGIDEELKSEVDFLPVPVSRWTSWTKNRSFAENCAKLVRSRSFDIVHGLSRVEGLDTYRLTDPMQTHWVNVWYRNPVSRWLQLHNPRHRTILDLERKLYQKSGVRRVIVQSKLDARLLTEYFGVEESRIRRIMNGVDTRIFNIEARRDAVAVREELSNRVGTDLSQSPLIVFASMDFRRKGLDSLLLALSKLKNKDACLLVLGNGQIRHYEQKAASLGLRHRVIFAGRQSSIQRYYGAADLFVLPTIYEPFPNVNLEAMACGTPVITTATAGGADLIEPDVNGYVIPDAWAVDRLAEQIDDHLNLPSEKLNDMRANCARIAAGFRVEENARKVAEVFDEVLREKNAA